MVLYRQPNLIGVTMHRIFRPLAVAALMTTAGLAWASGTASVVTSLDCFGTKVEMRSACISEMAPYVECSSQILRIGDKEVQLRTKANRDLSAGEWACEDNKRLLVLMSNGANCEQCEKAIAFDIAGKQVRPGPTSAKAKPVVWKDIPVLNRTSR